jgi:hypothetical protein
MEMVISYLFIGVGVSWLFNFIKSDAGAGEEYDLSHKVLLMVLWPISVLGLAIGLFKHWMGL